ncbi:MAG: Fe-S protein assembly chaperone HscA, partial [Gammaproteobacteria bacterium]
AADKVRRTLRERQVEARRHIESLQAALQQDGDNLLSADEKRKLEQVMQELAVAATGEDALLIDRLTESLNNLSRDFAGRRMDAGIKAALAGQRLDSLGDKL